MLEARLVRAVHHALILCLVVGSMVVLSAQSILDPRYVEFSPSADHNTLSSDGSPLVTRYYLSIYPQGSTTAFATVDLGKPSPNSSGVIRVDFMALLTVTPTPGVTYEGRVTAIGPGGANASTASNTFGYSLGCAPTISPTSRSISQASTTGSVGVSAGTGCGWTAASNASWITITGGSSGSGSGTVSYSVAGNTATAGRTGTMTIAGQTFTITQAGAACTYSLTPTSDTSPAAGESATASVSTVAGCGWTATSGASWITITGGASGSGNGTVGYSVAQNTAGSQRTGTLTIAGQSFTVTQTAAACSYSVTPTSRTSPATGDSSTASVAAGSGCSWTASSGASWISIANGASGTGDGSVGFTVAANSSSLSRTGTLTIAGQAFSVTQNGVGCSYSISPVGGTVGAAGGSGSTTVTTPAGCTWTAATNAAWLAVTAGGAGSGSGTVSFSAAANTSTQPRSGTLTVAGQIFTVNQAAATCSYAVSPTSLTVAAAAGTGSTSVNTTSGCAWSTTSNASWITAGSSGDGSGTATFSVAANTGSVSRSGSVSIAGRTVSITQSGSTCTYALSPTSQSLPAVSSTGSTVLTTGSQCSWTARAGNNWITVNTASGTGGATVSYSARANTSANPRTGTITIGSQVLTVRQSGSAPPGNPQKLRITTGGN